MKKGLFIGCIAVCFMACGTTSPAYIDDTYYYPEKSGSSGVSGVSGESGESGESGTAIEYVNVQDTTVTIRVKK